MVTHYNNRVGCYESGIVIRVVSKYSDIRMIQESSDAYRTHEWLVEPETPVHGVVTTVNGSAYQTYRVQLDDGNSVKVESQDITRAGDYTLF